MVLLETTVVRVMKVVVHAVVCYIMVQVVTLWCIRNGASGGSGLSSTQGVDIEVMSVVVVAVV